MADYKGVKSCRNNFDLSTGVKTFPADDEGIVIINGGMVVVPSTVVVNVEGSYDGGATYETINATATNQKVSLDGLNYTRIKLTFVSGSTSVVRAVYYTGGGGGGAFSFNSSTGSLKVEEQNQPNSENNSDGVVEVSKKLLATATDAYSTDISTVLEASSITKASSGRFFGIKGFIDSSASNAQYYLHVINASVLPADGAVTFLCNPIPISHTTSGSAGTKFEYTPDTNGIYASSGIIWYISSTRDTKTITGAVAHATAFFK